MTNESPIPYSLGSGNINNDIKAIQKWIEADIKYQIWALNTNSISCNENKVSTIVIDKTQPDTEITEHKKDK